MSFFQGILRYSSHGFVVLSFAAFCAGQVNAGIFGPSSFEECMAKEMKGRSDSQIRLVRDLCRKKFPAFPDYVDMRKNGVLNCRDTKDFQIEITQSALHTPWGSFKIMRRVPSYVVSENSEITLFEKWGKGTGLDINFEYGTVFFYSSKNHQHSYPNVKCSAN